ncbi:MAG: hypothetical protein E7516_04210 [Ruminococcaceae bacterium]|nr:hypothetical protein [Oscillospiraceae bacterium]
MKKLTAIILALAFILTLPTGAFALSKEGGIEPLKAQFVQDEGPETNGYTVDYSYYSPVKENDTTKYPLVVWLHGMGDGKEPGAPVKKSNIAYWTSDEFQARFKPAGGAFILAARSREEDNIFWSNEMIEPLRAAIDEFIAYNKENIDLTRIYVGGYSMGGKMTLKMAVAYPEMFAAAFPICPAWSPSEELCGMLADTPVWITSSTRDPLVNYYMAVSPTFERITTASNVAEDCRLSTLTKVCYEDGTKTSSSHHAWFAVNHDMFTDANGDYHNMSTVNGLGEEVKLSYPDGMICWLTSHTSDYDGTPIAGTGNLTPEHSTDNIIHCDGVLGFFELLFNAIKMIIGIK